MSVIKELISRYRNMQISVTLSDDLLPHVTHVDKESTVRECNINLYKLIYAIGSIQTRRKSPSNRMKFMDRADLIDWIYNTDEFRIKIDEIRNHRGGEVLGTISQDIGVGISVLVTKSLFGIKDSTIQRIYDTRKRPDWECLTQNNRTLVVESKGASSMAVSNAQKQRAINQKNRRIADIRVASLTVLNEHKITSNKLLDPPSNPDKMNMKRKNKILRAGHYSTVFSFLGHGFLSRYYSQMRKRLLDEITPEEQINKNLMFKKLRDDYTEIEFMNHYFVGTFYKIEEGIFFFVGIDKMLLSYQGFNTFKDYDNEVEETVRENHYILFKDGILLIEIQNLEEFEGIISESDIQNYQENNTISDVDEMKETSFVKYVSYLLIKLGFKITLEESIRNFRADIIAIKDKQRFIFELKLMRGEIQGDILEQLRQYKDKLYLRGIIVLITNASTDNIKTENEGIIILGRTELKQILKDNNRLKKFLGFD